MLEHMEVTQQSFVSRLFRCDLDTGSWYVEFIDVTAEADQEAAYRAEDEEGPRAFYGIDDEAETDMSDDLDTLPWSDKRRR